MNSHDTEINPAADDSDGPDVWAPLQRYTTARIALGRTGGSLPTRELLRFSYDHALARDAVHAPFDHEAFAEELRALSSLNGPSHAGHTEVVTLTSAAPDRTVYLQRPDLGRALSAESRKHLTTLATSGPADLVIILSDGLSALAAQRQGLPFLRELLPLLQAHSWILAPLCVVRHGRVAIQDEVGGLLRARMALILIGERPGLGAADSLGAYFVHGPKPGNSNAQRNCISNIRPEGLALPVAANKLIQLLNTSRSLQISGVGLKEEVALSPSKSAQSSLI